MKAAFRKERDYLRECINPDDIATRLFAKDLITSDDLWRIQNPGNNKKGIDALLEASQLSINRDAKTFMATFLNILNAIPVYKIVADKLLASLKGKY